MTNGIELSNIGTENNNEIEEVVVPLSNDYREWAEIYQDLNENQRKTYRQNARENGQEELLAIYDELDNPGTTVKEEKTEAEIAKEEARAEKLENWAREDEIRKEVEEREDNAYQRAVADMIKAGINPAIFGVSAASSGGGITSATKSDYTIATEMLNKAYNSKEKSKDRDVKVLTALMAVFAVVLKGLAIAL